MKNFLSIISVLVTMFIVTACSLTVDAATINTVKTSISKVESKAKGFKAAWKKKSKISGYQIQYSTSSKFKNSITKTKTITGAKKTSTTISKLKGCNTKYYVRVRTYKNSNGKKVYSSWSSTKKVTTLNHKFNRATCTKAKTCKYCKKISGKALGHKYSAATCKKSKTCTRCKATAGKALGHKYSNSCDQSCNVCKATRTVKHTYKSATCTVPKTCKKCSATSGSPKGHSVLTEYDSRSDSVISRCKSCTYIKSESVEPLKLNFVKIHSHYYEYIRFLSFNFSSEGGYGALTYTFILYNNDMTKIISQCTNETGKGDVIPQGHFKDTKLKVIVRDKYGHSDENIYDTQSLDIDWWYNAALSVAKYEANKSSVTPNWYYHTILENRYNNNIIDYVNQKFTIDWRNKAKIYAQYCLDRQSYTKDELIKKLTDNGFTQEQAVYGVEINGL